AISRVLSFTIDVNNEKQPTATSTIPNTASVPLMPPLRRCGAVSDAMWLSRVIVSAMATFGLTSLTILRRVGRNASGSPLVRTCTCPNVLLQANGVHAHGPGGSSNPRHRSNSTTPVITVGLLGGAVLVVH